MRILKTIPAFLSALLLAAHFLRGGHLALVGLCLAVAVASFVPARPVPALVRAALALGVLEWLRTAYRLTELRMALGEGYARMLAILLAVAAFCAWAAWLLPAPRAVAPTSPDETV